MNKRGISPLIATVLLISFVVILSAVIMFWGKQYVTDLMEKRGDVASAKLDCERVEMEIVSVAGNELVIRNTSPLRLNGFILKFDTGHTQNVNTIFQSYEEKPITLTLSGNTVNIIPLLKPDGIGAPPIPCSTKHKLVRLISGG